jgi:hypothetical protein
MNINSQDKYGNTVLHANVLDLARVRILVEKHKANLLIQNHAGKTMGDLASTKSKVRLYVNQKVPLAV